ncbi:MAG: MFS transporter [Puniceicoccales bacterium]|nr:MFS transporter [Puniceicoccales bacterium]
MAAVVFYLYEYLVRVAPSAMEQELEEAFHTSSVALAGALGAYYFVYSPIQLLAGALFDRFGGKKVLIPASLLVVLGCLLISLPSANLGTLATSRIFMGLGSGFGFIGVMYLAAMWFRPEKLALVSGLTTSLGILGALVGQAPLSWLVDAVGWRSSWAYIALTGVLSTLALVFFVPEISSREWKDAAVDGANSGTKGFLSGLLCVCKNKQTWIIGFVAGTLYAPIVTFGDLWGIQYVRLIADVTKTEAACVVGMLFIGWLVGGPLAGYITQKALHQRSLLMISCVATSLILGLIFLVPIKSQVLLGALLFACGMASSPQVICFVASLEANPSFAKGSSIAVVNMIVMLLGGIFQPIVGWLMHSSNAMYDVDAFRLALLSLPLLTLVGCFAAFFLAKKERANE